MFSDECICTIFGNIEQIFQFASTFLKDLEKNVSTDDPHRSEIGNCFLDFETEFQIYSEYCNNHPFACEELHRLQFEKKYQHFFEACRLLQQMIEIPLEGFLLTPVQKICKYPLQLKELLKYTHLEHPDYTSLQRALEMMKKTAMLINERKRKMESLEKLAQWQKTVAYWQGPSLLDNSSELIYSGETSKVSTNGSQRLRIIFLFDHQLIFCKKDILWRELFVFKGRIFMDNCTVYAIHDCKESMQLKHGFRIHDRINDIWYTFSCRNPEDEERWLRAFHEERQRVDLDRENGFDLRKFKEKAFSSQLKRQMYPSQAKDKNQLRKKVYLSDEMSPSLSPSGPPQPKKGFLGFMQRRYRR